MVTARNSPGRYLGCYCATTVNVFHRGGVTLRIHPTGVERVAVMLKQDRIEKRFIATSLMGFLSNTNIRLNLKPHKGLAKETF